jgi:flagellar motor switch protein FliM
MSRASNNLSNEKIRELLTAVGTGSKEDATGIETTEYNWNQPHFFDRKQLSKLDDSAKKVAKAMAVKFDDFCHSEFDVTVVSTTQHFASELIEQALEKKQNDYYLAFGTDEEHACGLIRIPTQTAFIWVTQLLGDPESEEEDSGRDLSQLEESLLLDLLSALLGTFFHEIWDFQPVKNIVRGLLPIELKGTEELCKITFDVKKVGKEKGSETSIIILCSKLEPVMGKAEQTVGVFSTDDISKVIIDHMQQMPVCITAQLASTMLTLEEIMNLEVGDVLLLDKKIDEPVELKVNDRTAFRGQPAKSAGKHAVVITELSSNTG